MDGEIDRQMDGWMEMGRQIDGLRDDTGRWGDIDTVIAGSGFDTLLVEGDMQSIQKPKFPSDLGPQNLATQRLAHPNVLIRL